MRVKLMAGLAALALSVPALAAPGAQENAAAAAAWARGQQMFAYDQAAWHASDAFQADIARESRDLAALVREEGLAGYDVEPEAGGALRATFYGRRQAEPHAVARYVVAAGKVAGGGFVRRGEESALSPLALRLIAARDLALAAMQQGDHPLCSADQPNTLVLPPDEDDVISAYVLTATTQAGVYPAGGHYRFDVGADGKLAGERRFMKSCFPVDYRKQGGKVAEGLFLTHLLDPQPTEIHAFVRLNIPAELYVATVGNGAIWKVGPDRVTYVSDVPRK